MAKKILVAVVVILVVLAGAFYFLYSSLGSIVKAAIEKYGTAATQAQVKVDSVTLSATSGQGAINGLVVSNPAGFTTPQAFDLGSVSVTIDISTLAQNPVEIKDINITAPHVTYEQGSGGSNLQKLQQNVTQYAGGAGSGKAQPASASQTSSQPERKLIIDKLDITGGQITVAAALLKGQALSTSLPAIHLTDIGKKEGGATPAEVAQLLISAISEQATKAATGELQKALGGQLQQLQNKAPTDVGSQLKGLLK